MGSRGTTSARLLREPARCAGERCHSRRTTAHATASENVLQIWREADAVCFDVDSTVCPSEGIDDLAEYLGKGDEGAWTASRVPKTRASKSVVRASDNPLRRRVDPRTLRAVAALTSAAMAGGMPFQDALSARLDLLRPSATDIAAFLGAHPPRLTPGIAELVHALHNRSKLVYLVSGGFRVMINPVADMLGVPKERIFANTILFAGGGQQLGEGGSQASPTGEGAYVGFDASEFTSQAGGKAAAARHIKAQSGARVLVMVGDGATDLEARTQDGAGADLFVGFGGIVKREKVLSAADWAVEDFSVLIEAL